MPQDLEKLLLNRPQPVQGNPQLPEGDPNSLGNKIERFFTTGLGLSAQKPGDLASALGAAASMLPIGRGISAVRNGLGAGRAAESAVPAGLRAFKQAPEEAAMLDRSLPRLLDRNANGVRVKIYDQSGAMGKPTLLHEQVMDYDPSAIKQWHEQYFAPGSTLRMEPVDLRGSRRITPNEGLVPSFQEKKIQ